MPTVIDRKGVLRLVQDEGAQLVEVLPTDEYVDEHLPDAVHLPLKSLDATAAAAVLDRGRPVIVYCWDGL
jgi:rhodanese-related sulfurtransferase